MTKKLIEVALPLEKINAESAREKSIRHGHPSTLHLWWARRPLAAARAVIWASLVDDPSSHPEEFPTEKEQNDERRRLFKILEELVVWENSNNEKVLNAAKKEIMKSTGDNPPAFLDPFAGGGAIPLEAQRLGLESHAHDLNPVAVMINKAMIEVPPKFTDMPPVNPSDRMSHTLDSWSKAEGLSADVRYYGEWLKNETFNRIGHLYPKIEVPKDQGGGEATVIAWIWARTVKCPNPACGCATPLTKTFVLSKKKGNEAYIDPVIEDKSIKYVVKKGIVKDSGTITKSGAECIFCGASISFDYIRDQGREKQLESDLMAIVAESGNGRRYYSATDVQIRTSIISADFEVPETPLPEKALGFRVQLYGMKTFQELHTKRQLLMLKTFCDVVHSLCDKVLGDAKELKIENDHIPLNEGGSGVLAYAQALQIYLSFVIDKMADYNSSICSWHNSGEKLRNTFGRPTLSMNWDYTEANPFSDSSGSFSNMLDWVCKSIVALPYADKDGIVEQKEAQADCGLRDIMVSTDPPYYDNIGYADLSDFFYSWLRLNLQNIYPSVFRTISVPKSEELIAAPHRFEDDMNVAKTFFEEGMAATCSRIFQYVRYDVPLTVYYAYKQTDSSEEKEVKASSGWETMLSALIGSGFAITGTWPMRTELANRTRGLGSNALASSIVLVCRKRPLDAPQITRRNLVNALRKELRPALHKLQDSNIAPVDLAQSAIGPGMGVFSRYSKVLEADGTPMTVRSALQVINEEIDLYFNEQVGDLDASSRFCVDLYTQNAYNDVKFGEAEVLANAKSASIPLMTSKGFLYAKAGNVHLIERDKLSEKIDVNESNVWLLTQQLTHAMEKGGVEACSNIVVSMFGSNAERAKDLAYRLYTIAEQKKWANEAYAYNSLVVAWPDIQSRAAALKAVEPEQMTLFDLNEVK